MKILIAEDDFVSRIVLHEILSPYGTCHETVDGLETLTAFRMALDSGTPYDLICLDIMMPKMDGQQVLLEIRKEEQARGIGGYEMVKVVMTTAVDDPKSIMSAFIKGHCEAYLTKPIGKDSLLTTLRELGLIH